MATETTTRTTVEARPAAARRRTHIRAELAGYLALAAGLFALLWVRTAQVDSFYLDEWFYVHGAEYMWEHFPGAVLGTIPEWNRGPQRAYSALLMVPWGLFGTSTAYTVTHVMNVALLVSAIVPAALLARRVIESPLLRVLAVALAVAVPWLTIGAHLLTENLAFPLFLWAVYLIVRTAESPTLLNQALAIAAAGGLGLVRLNLAPVFGVLVLAVLAAEVRRRREEGTTPLGAWIARALRREALIAAATVLAAAAALTLLLRGAGSLGAYGGFSADSITDSLFGDKADETRRTVLTYLRSLVVGSFVMPLALGLGAALAGLFGRLGRPLFIPSLAALGALAVVLVGVSIWTAGFALEERYVFYAYAPVAVLAVAALEHLDRLRGWITAGGALTLWALIAGLPFPGQNGGNFFAAPAGAFWSRVVDHRLRAYEQDLFGWMFIGPTGWLLMAVALGVLAFVVGRAPLRRPLLIAGLGVCLLGQVLVLNYSYRQELFGTRDAPGGIALGPGRGLDRETWLDPRIPDGATAGVLPGLLGIDGPYGGAERVTFWNRDLDVTVATAWNGAPVPAPPGHVVLHTIQGPDGLATWDGELPEWLTAHADDPRLQFAGQVVAQSPSSRFVLYRTARAERALWTGVGVDADGALLRARPAVFALDRAGAPGARTVTLGFHLPSEAPRPTRWRIERGGREVASGRVAPGKDATVRLAVPPCPASACDPAAWELRAVGPGVPMPIPAYGAPPPARPVTLFVRSARIA